jgi:hypothetical protein
MQYRDEGIEDEQAAAVISDPLVSSGGRCHCQPVSLKMSRHVQRSRRETGGGVTQQTMTQRSFTDLTLADGCNGGDEAVDDESLRVTACQMRRLPLEAPVMQRRNTRLGDK